MHEDTYYCDICKKPCVPQFVVFEYIGHSQAFVFDPDAPDARKPPNKGMHSCSERCNGTVEQRVKEALWASKAARRETASIVERKLVLAGGQPS